MRAVHRDDVHARQHLVEALPVGRLELALDLGMDALAVVIVDRKAEAARAARQRLADAAHADDAHALAQQPGAQHRGRAPAGPLACAHHAARPAPMRRAVASTSAIDMSAVSSVSTPGVLVTVMPRWRAVSRSMWSTPVPNEAISFSRGPACDSTRLSMRSVTVGTSTSAAFTASTSSARAQRLVVGIQPGVEQLHQPRLDRVGQLPGDDHQRLFL